MGAQLARGRELEVTRHSHTVPQVLCTRYDGASWV